MVAINYKISDKEYTNQIDRVHGPHMNAVNGQELTLSDSTEFEEPSTLYIGTGGTVKVTTWNGQEISYINVADGSFLTILIKKVWLTGTTASDIIREY